MRFRSFSKTLTISILCLAGLFSQDTWSVDSNNIVRLSTTTTATSSGMLESVLPAFERETGLVVQVEAFGTGRTLRRARDGNADVIIVHDEAAEQKFMKEGFGLERLPLMKNEFVLVGPKDDPAGVTDSPDSIDAFIAIARSKSLFVSRGDDSGTHNRELSIWNRSGLEPTGRWYIEYGYGMGKTLQYADKMSAYVMVDRSTWLAKRDQLRLVLLLDGDPLLDNPYHIISVNPERHPAVNLEGAQQLIEWMTSRQGQDMIKSITVDGEQLFIPAFYQ